MTDTSKARAAHDLPEALNAAEDLLAPNLAKHPDKTAIIDSRGTCSYRELAERVATFQGMLNDLGVRRGERVLLCLTDTRDFPTAFLGAIRAGVVPVPLNTLLTSEDYSWIAENSDAAAVFVSAELSDKWHGVAGQRPDLRMVSSGGGPWDDLETLLGTAEPAASAADTHRDDVAFWLYTSGSTGNPKGAMHLHGSIRLTANLYGIGTIGMREDDVVLSVAKQFFAYGLGNALSFPYAAGATVVLFDGRPLPEPISQLVREHGVSVLGVVPTFLAGWLSHPSCPSRRETPALRMAISAGEALPSHLGMAFHERFGAHVLDGLGSTEMLHIFVSQRPDSLRYGCTGRVIDGYEVRVVDESGEAVPVGEIGNLEVRGPTTAAAYWRNRIKSMSTFKGEWTATGDKYTINEDGWLTYAGRSDDMLKVGGIYVSPIEVEEVLAGHPDVIEAAVVTDTDDDGLVKPHGFVVAREGVDANDELASILQAHVKQHLAPYKYPRWITFVDELPKTATGKIQRFRLREAS
ncbi:acetyl-CoA synthetase [Novosphingobium endophyticum]|uniref:Acetyl-CoA synthetase n=1 Tax=Novosphingobium endophyticum TaxID=1955250 RepID=A0A916TR53_9SPHN|nr:benzoate-CoA ligase family protein [Novosphingobium endophyticum]GGB94772.1 acetyl-CoA synthetase [Novosphingobium endophyticum]